MAKQDYIPQRLGNLAVWLSNYKAKLTANARILGITDAELNAQIALVDALLGSITANEQVQQNAQKATADLRRQKAASVKAIRALAQNIKTRPAYTGALGEDLGIVGDEQTVDVHNSKPKIKTRKVETGYELSFGLDNFFDGVKIFRQRPGELKRFIAVDTSSPYVDAEPTVNGTAYTAFFMLGDETVGLESDPAVIQI